MPCMCGGCHDCLVAQGYYCEHESCPVCEAELPLDNTTGFCSDRCENEYVAEMQQQDRALALQLAEEAQLADDYWNQEKARQEAALRAFLLDD